MILSDDRFKQRKAGSGVILDEVKKKKIRTNKIDYFRICLYFLFLLSERVKIRFNVFPRS